MPDAATMPDAGEPVADAGQDSRVAEPDGGAPRDGATDAEGAAVSDATPDEPDALVVTGPCLDDDSVLGGECPNVVMCTSEGLCDLTRNSCCVSQLTSSCSPVLNCSGEQQRLRCDGPEDCAPGKVCCAAAGATSCVAAGACPVDGYLACHTDSDCVGRRCLEGLPGTIGLVSVLYFAHAGLCRGL